MTVSPASPPVGLLRKVISGDGRKSRLHDALGRRVTLSRLLRNGPRAFAAAIANKITGWRPARPWIAYDGQALIDRHLGADAQILEFGSGMSTRWYAQRAARVISHESNSEWHALVSRQLERYTDVVLLNRAVGHGYHEIDPLYGNTRFNFVMVDGYDREQCVISGLKHLASGGVLYLDNSDMIGGEAMGDVQAARRRIFEHQRKCGGEIVEITDFAPAQLFVTRATIYTADAVPASA